MAQSRRDRQEAQRAEYRARLAADTTRDADLEVLMADLKARKFAVDNVPSEPKETLLARLGEAMKAHEAAFAAYNERANR